MRKRIITSYSNVITNSSTQVFFLDIDKKLLELLKDNSMIDEVIIVNNKEDVIRAVETYVKESNTNHYSNSYLIFNALYYAHPDMYGFFDNWGNKGSTWLALNEGGKTDKEIIDFLWPVISDVSGKIYYSFSDDCGTTELARLLWKNGYPSERE